MKKLFILLSLFLLLSGCTTIIDSQSSTDASTGTGVSSSELSTSSSSKPEFKILGQYVCDSDYHRDDFNVQHPESVPFITFRDDGNCSLYVNYLNGCEYVHGTYSIENDRIQVELDFHGTYFEGKIDPATGGPWMDNHYVFQIIDDNQIIIDREFYTVNAGDTFVRYIRPLSSSS